MSNRLDPDGPDLGPNCLPKLSADVTGKQELNNTGRKVGRSIARKLQLLNLPKASKEWRKFLFGISKRPSPLRIWK